MNTHTINALSRSNQDNGYNNEWPSITRAEQWSDKCVSGSDTWTADLLTATNYNCHGHMVLHGPSFLKTLATLLHEDDVIKQST